MLPFGKQQGILNFLFDALLVFIYDATWGEAIPVMRHPRIAAQGKLKIKGMD